MKTQKQNQDVRARAQLSLFDSLGAVSLAIDTMPDAPRGNARNVSEQFMRSDDILSKLYKNILDARANLAALVAKYGLGDAMIDTMTYQLSALEAAYAQRLALLRKRREEQSRGTKPIEVGDSNAFYKTPQVQAKRKSDNNFWLMAAVLMLNDSGVASKKNNGLALSAA